MVASTLSPLHSGVPTIELRLVQLQPRGRHQPATARIEPMAQVTQLPLRALVEAHRDEIKTIVARHKGTSVALFGSVARGEETPESDIDLLVSFGPGASLFDVVNIEFDVQDLLGCKVDVVSRRALLDEDDDIRREAVPL